MTRIRLALMLYFFMVAHKAACQTLKKAFLKSMKTVEDLLMLEIFFRENSYVKIYSVVRLPALKPACSSAMISACGFNLFSMIFSMTSLGWLTRLIVR